MPATRFTWQLQLNAPQRRHAAQRMRHAAHVRPVGIQHRQGDVLQVAQRRQRPQACNSTDAADTVRAVLMQE